ncbi:MAG TPA: ribosomal protein S18-alanine N-acetyltransferase [Chloroflexi bacterium]|nr:ribosomal protein S18-alanine N-acetyltransferase [Chloroflexota bacterium]
MPAPQVLIQPMSLQDIPVIEELEAACFPEPWSGDIYRHELAHNRLSAYWVARPVTPDAQTAPPILAYGGYWAMGPEVHIVTVATHPGYRRQGLGRVLMAWMIEHARAGGALEVTLEVRASNHAAQSLYAQMGFVVVGRRKGYYRDNGEDAILMTLFLPEARTEAPANHLSGND